MPIEFRRLVFHGDELLDALAVVPGRSEDPLPAGRIVGYKVVSKPEVTVRVEIEPEDRDDPATGDGGRLSVTLEPAFVAAALIRLCIRRGIPMSRRAEKSLGLEGDNLALILTLDAPEAEIAATEPVWLEIE